MGIATSDVIPLSQARANLSELADQVNTGVENIITNTVSAMWPGLMPNAWITTTSQNASVPTFC